MPFPGPYVKELHVIVHADLNVRNTNGQTNSSGILSSSVVTRVIKLIAVQVEFDLNLYTFFAKIIDFDLIWVIGKIKSK